MAQSADITPIAAVVPAQRPIALFADIDGTLLNLAPHPDAVVVDDDLRQLLDGLDTRLRGAFALVSGRTLADIDRLFAPRRFAAAGLHGLEWRLKGAGDATLLAMPRELRNLSVDIANRLSVFPGVLIERKGPAMALHYRRAPEAEAHVYLAAQDALKTLGSGYRLLEGHAVVELIPANANKGGAIRHFMAAEPFAGRVPVFIGDDVTDESGFAAVNELGGLSVRVGPTIPTAASAGLPDVAATRAWLADVANGNRAAESE
jgi:trehalose 6-phosphate phosphatase